MQVIEKNIVYYTMNTKLKNLKSKKSLVIDIWEKKQEIKILAGSTLKDYSDYVMISFYIKKLETEINKCNTQLKKY